MSEYGSKLLRNLKCLDAPSLHYITENMVWNQQLVNGVWPWYSIKDEFKLNPFYRIERAEKCMHVYNKN